MKVLWLVKSHLCNSRSEEQNCPFSPPPVLIHSFKSCASSIDQRRNRALRTLSLNRFKCLSKSFWMLQTNALLGLQKDFAALVALMQPVPTPNEEGGGLPKPVAGLFWPPVKFGTVGSLPENTHRKSG